MNECMRVEVADQEAAHGPQYNRMTYLVSPSSTSPKHYPISSPNEDSAFTTMAVEEAQLSGPEAAQKSNSVWDVMRYNVKQVPGPLQLGLLETNTKTLQTNTNATKDQSSQAEHNLLHS